ncbi:MAG TPA: hypothetical protein VG406_03355 [Isosphaeraceae bacterium]|jgi:hypothetical protein|nr:hypothetical protein [Isosphaeraceae bacterium]
MGATAFEILILPVCWLTLKAIAAGALILAVKSVPRPRHFEPLHCHRAPTPRKDRA